MPASDPATQAVFLIDEHQILTSWNAACVTQFGYQAEQTLGQPITMLLAPSSVPIYRARWATLPTQFEATDLTIRCADASEHLARLALAPQFDDDGQCHTCVVAVRNTSEESELDLVSKTPLIAIANVFAGTFYVINEAGRLVLWNDNLARVVDMDPKILGQAHVLDMFLPSQRPMIAEKVRQVFHDNAEVLIEADYVGKDGKQTPYLLSGTPITRDGKRFLCGIGLDMSCRREQERKLRIRERALHATSSGIVITRCAGRDNPIEYVNPAFERICGYTIEESLGRDPRFMEAPALDVDERAKLRESIRERRRCTVVFRNVRKNGELFWNELTISPVPDERGIVSHFIGVVNDITSTRQRTVDLEHDVNHDPLTGLANRNLLMDRLDQSLHLAQRSKTLVAVVLIDLDAFKGINDSLGHEAGDKVLTVVARRLEASVRDTDTVARLSGDEFVLVLANQPSLRFTLRMVERVRAHLARPVQFDAIDIPVGASMGVAIYPHDGSNHFELLRAADVAMYHAKGSGKNDVHFFSPDMKTTTEAKQKMETSMRLALETDQFFLQFGPRVNLISGRLVGVEALLRWRHPEHGVLLPVDFLAEAEENGMIVPIGMRVFDLVCDLMEELHRRQLATFTVSMNVSYREYFQHDFVSRMAAQLTGRGLPAAVLEVELREEQMLRNEHLSLDVAEQLHAIGVRLAVDNFGDGLSSFSALQRLPLAHVKIGRQPIGAICPETHTGPLAKALLDTANNLVIPVVASAVETRGQAEFLRDHGCDEAQGLFYGDTLDRAGLEARLDAEAALAPS